MTISDVFGWLVSLKIWQEGFEDGSSLSFINILLAVFMYASASQDNKLKPFLKGKQCNCKVIVYFVLK